MNCTYASSTIEIGYQSKKTEENLSQYLDIKDGLRSITYVPKTPGEYKFKPRIKCKNDEYPVEISCERCTFVVPTSQLDKERFKLYSDFKNDKFFSSELKSGANSLYISLDEGFNRKLTEMSFVDTSGVDFALKSINVKRITASITPADQKNPIPLEAKFNPAGLIEFYIPKSQLSDGKDRSTVFSPLIKYDLSITIDDDSYKLTGERIPIVFQYRDDYLNNVNNVNVNEDPANFLATYVPGTFTLRTASNQLLFKIMARNTNKELSMGASLKCDKLVLNVQIDGKASKIESDCSKQSGMFLYVTGSLTAAKPHTIEVVYDGKSLTTVPVQVIPRSEVSKLDIAALSLDLISKKDQNVITLKDITVDDTFSFVFNMLDMFDNTVKDYLSAFNSITIVNSGSERIQPLIDGRLVIIGDSRAPGDSKVDLTLPNGKKYTLQWKKVSTKIDPTVSTSEINFTGATLGATVQTTKHAPSRVHPLR